MDGRKRGMCVKIQVEPAVVLPSYPVLTPVQMLVPAGKAKGIATGIQAERMGVMNGIVSALGGDGCK